MASVPYRRVCPEVIQERKETARIARAYQLQQLGPVAYVINVEGEPRSQRVCLGNVHTCTCATYRRERDLCLHILWVMLRLLRIAPSDPLTWQIAFSESDMQRVLDQQHQRQRPPVERKLKENTRGRERGGSVDRRPVEKGDICPICCVDLKPGETFGVTFCKTTCGKNMHISCMQALSNHQTRGSHDPDQPVTCPLCRQFFATKKEIETASSKYRTELARKRGAAKKRRALAKTLCSHCHCILHTMQGQMYKCLVCPGYIICESCYCRTPHHHPNFEVRNGPLGQWRAVAVAPRLGPSLPCLIVQELRPPTQYTTQQDIGGGAHQSARQGSVLPRNPPNGTRLVRCTEARSQHDTTNAGQVSADSNRGQQATGVSTLAPPRPNCGLCMRPCSPGRRGSMRLKSFNSCGCSFHLGCLLRHSQSHTACPTHLDSGLRITRQQRTLDLQPNQRSQQRQMSVEARRQLTASNQGLSEDRVRPNQSRGTRQAARSTVVGLPPSNTSSQHERGRTMELSSAVNLLDTPSLNIAGNSLLLSQDGGSLPQLRNDLETMRTTQARLMRGLPSTSQRSSESRSKVSAASSSRTAGSHCSAQSRGAGTTLPPLTKSILKTQD